tara:strand:- start:71 stop:490 length:420 start_codon:yes stop_codon:yes gene_type:complete
MHYSDTQLTKIFKNTKRIAVVGASMNPSRPSYYVAQYLITKGYDIVPVNPAHAGLTLFDATVSARLSDIEGPVDMVDIFRRSEAVPEIIDEALEVFPDLGTIWMQIGVQHPVAAAKAEAKGVAVIQNRCPKIEFQRLFG